MLAQARLLLAQGEQAAAAQHLATLHGMASSAGFQSTAAKARALQALAAPSPEQALDFLAEALAWAEPENYVRTFVDAGEPMKALLHAAVEQGIAAEYVHRLLSAFEGETKDDGRTALASASLVEPLSDRELDVLRLLAGGRTNQEIANALYISVNTVKTHLKNIYGKLGVSNRRKAVAEAKKLGLVA
jgi:LuxR family transcriptional regulator, maltose regulon positive regulatory protein